MEVIHGTVHAAFPIADPSRVGEARRHAVQLAHEAGMGEVDAGRVALVVTELATNLLRHAKQGLLLLARTSSADVEVIALDKGPGMPDVARSLRDGFSTGGTPGTGLGAVARLADDFDIHSTVPEGTAVLARVRSATSPAPVRSLRVGAVSVCAPGEVVCGDAWCFGLDGARGSLLVADGLGHGPQAAEAAQAAVQAFMADPFADCRAFVQQAHHRLRSTRGAAIAVYRLDGDDASVQHAGAGNVLARLVSGVTDRTLVTQHGTAGLTIRSVDVAQTPWPEHALLVAHSDGIESRWRPDALAPLLRRDPTLAAAVLLRDHSRGRDDATVAVIRRKD
ncbi:ATP-binding protein [Ramlibacter sp. AW1]|uniref:ATP-binding protein n=1 Tax=Ramlibacter aurantiacus TaxID=2801330 RepID=A0A936ZGK2_9BURK|nr:ATP-binding protein [Ramlibacter aurantiacus]